MRSFVIQIPGYNFQEYTRRPHYEALSSIANVVIVPKLIPFFRINYQDKKKVTPKKNITILRNSYGLPERLCKKSKILNKIQEFLMKKRLQKHVDESSIFILTNDNMFTFWAQYSNIKIFDLTDAPWHLSRLSNIEKSKRLEVLLKVIFSVDIVFCTSIKITEFAYHLNRNSFYLPNTAKLIEGVEYEESDNKCIKFGFIGNINEWIDIDLVAQMAELIDNVEVIFLGDVNGTKEFRKAFSELTVSKKVRHIKRVPMDEIGSILRTFDVGIIPYVKNIFNEYVYPNKLIMYLNFGLTVLSTDFCEDLEGFRDIIDISENKDDFIYKAKKISSNIKTYNNELLFKKRRNIAFENSSLKRAKKRLEIIDQYLKDKLKNEHR